jgi:hypothetical protein
VVQHAAAAAEAAAAMAAADDGEGLSGDLMKGRWWIEGMGGGRSEGEGGESEHMSEQQ